VTRAARRWDPRQRKRSEALRLEPRASISQAVGARRNPSPRASAVARFRDCVRSTQRRRGVGARRDIAVRARAARPRRLRHGQRPWSGAVVVMSAGAEGKGRFHGSISVSDTIGTLLPPHLEIVTLFRLAYCCVMGRKAPRKRLTCRDTARPTGASHAPERLSALRPPLDSGARSKVANPGRRNAPRERDGLFEIVRAIVAWIERSEIRGRWFPHFAALNAGYEATIACPGSATHHVAALVLRCARDTREESTCGCGKRSPAPIPCFRPVINNGWHNQNA